MRWLLPISVVCILGAVAGGCRSDASSLRELAEAHWRKGDYDNAIRINRQLYARDPAGKNAAQALLTIGTIYYRNLRQIRKGIEVYNQVTQEFAGGPEEYQARILLAEIYSNEVVDLTQAISEYDRLLSWPKLENRAEILFRRADAYFKQEDFDRALRELQQLEASGITGHLADQVALKIGNIYQIQKRFEEAVGPFQKVTNSPCLECRRSAVLNLMETYENLYDFDKAIEAVRKLDTLPEGEARIQKEISRLEQKRRRLSSPVPQTDGSSKKARR